MNVGKQPVGHGPARRREDCIASDGPPNHTAFILLHIFIVHIGKRVVEDAACLLPYCCPMWAAESRPLPSSSLPSFPRDEPARLLRDLQKAPSCDVSPPPHVLLSGRLCKPGAAPVGFLWTSTSAGAEN